MRKPTWERELTNGKRYDDFQEHQHAQQRERDPYTDHQLPDVDAEIGKQTFYQFRHIDPSPVCYLISILINNHDNKAKLMLLFNNNHTDSNATINALAQHKGQAFPQNAYQIEYGPFDLSKLSERAEKFLSTLKYEIDLPEEISEEISKILNLNSDLNTKNTPTNQTHQEGRALQVTQKPSWHYETTPYKIGDIRHHWFSRNNDEVAMPCCEIKILINERIRSATVVLNFDEWYAGFQKKMAIMQPYLAPLKQPQCHDRIYGIFDLQAPDNTLKNFISLILDTINLAGIKEEIIEILHLTPNMNLIKETITFGQYNQALMQAIDIDKTLKWEAVYTTAQYLSEHYQQQANKAGLQQPLHEIKSYEIKAYQAVPNTSPHYHKANSKLLELMCDLNFQANLTPEQRLNHKEMQFKYTLIEKSEETDLRFAELCGAPGLSRLITNVAENFETLCNTAKVIREQDAEIKRLKIKCGETPATSVTQTTTPRIFTQSSTTKNKRKRTQNEPTGKPTTPDETIKHVNKKQCL